MDRRFKEINSRLIEYSRGHFNKRIKFSDKKDEVDAISNGINMLGEELNDATISKIYFNSIFNSLSEMVFILNKRGIIQDVNKAVEKKLQFSKEEITGKNIYRFYKKNNFIENENNLPPHRSVPHNYNILTIKNGNNIPVRVQTTTFKNAFDKELVILTATDISEELKAQNLLMHAIIQGEENERKRLSEDLHDGLIQQLSAAKFHVNSTLGMVENKKIKPSLTVSNKILADVIQEVRTICLNLVPPSLQEFGLLKAIKEYASRYNRVSKFEIVENTHLPEIPQELQHDLFRISQEFISNAIKHGGADKIKIVFSCENTSLKINFTDNGKGFDTTKRSDGMGLRNINGRIKSHNGVIKITSHPGKGTSIKILIPTHKQIWPSFKL
jgi:PAS domain S-box-containing protein